MSYKNGRILDGYDGYTSADGYNNSFVTPWVNVHSAPFFNFVTVFSATGTAGTLTLEQSNDRDATWTDGSIYPMSAQFVGVSGKGPYGDPIDLMQVPNASVSVSAGGTHSFDSAQLTCNGPHFLRVKYVASTSVACKITVTFSWKSAS